MKNVSEAYSNKMQDNLRTFIPRMTIDGTELDGDIQAGLSITLGSCGTQQFAIGACFIPTITASLAGCTTRLQDKEILLEMGLVLDDGSVEYKNIGYFTVERPATDKFQTSFTAYGRLMSKAGGVYISELSYPASIEAVLNEIKAQTGVNIVLNGLTAAGSINTPIVGEIHREALMRIAGLLGGFVTENGDGEFVIAKYGLNKAVTIDTDFCYSYPETNDLPYEVTGIEIVVSEGGKDDEGNDIEGVKFSSGSDVNVIIQNPYMTAELFETCASNVVGFSYMPAKVEFLGDIRLEPWDSIIVTDEDPAADIDVPCMNITHTWDGGLVTTITAPGETATETAGALGGPLSAIVDRTYQELLVAKQVIAKKVSAEYVKANYATIDKLDATEAYIQELEANMLTADIADLKYATIGSLQATDAKLNTLDAQFARIDLTNIKNGSITTAMLGTAVVGTTQIADGSITDAKIVELTANKITAGMLSVERLEIRGSTNSLVYAINNISGALQAQNVDTLNGEVLTSRTITADKIVTNAITANEIASKTITANEIVAGTITATEIAAGTITADKININDLFSKNITATGNFSLGGTGALKYSAATDELAIRVKSLTIGSTSIPEDAAKTATNFLRYDASGLVVGDMTATSLAENVLITANGVNIRKGEKELAHFAEDEILLGANSPNSSIRLCSRSANITVNTAIDGIDTFSISSDLYTHIKTVRILKLEALTQGYSTNISLKNLPGGYDGIFFETNSINSNFKFNGNDIFHAGNYSSYCLPLSGGTLTGACTFNSTVNMKNGIELHHSTPYIDFHFDNSAADFTSRIVESVAGTLSINGVTVTTGKVVTATTFSGALNGNAATATNADKVDGQHFTWSDPGGVPTYVWGAKANGQANVYSAKNLEVRHSDTCNKALSLNGVSAGDARKPVYFNNGLPVACEPFIAVYDADGNGSLHTIRLGWDGNYLRVQVDGTVNKQLAWK